MAYIKKANNIYGTDTTSGHSVTYDVKHPEPGADAAASPTRLTLIGGGHLAEALARGIYARSTWTSRCRISITARRASRADELRAALPLALVTLNNLDPGIWATAAEEEPGAHTVILGVRPADTRVVVEQIAPALAMLDPEVRPTVVTVCPGILVEQLERWLPRGTAVVRSMPNTPVGCCEGATALFPNQEARERGRVGRVVVALKDVSPAVCVLEKEEQLDVVAAIAGSAPAYFYYMIEALVAAGEAHGIPANTVKALVSQSCLGAGLLAREAGRPPSVLRKEVCVPGGSTEKGIAKLTEAGFHDLIRTAAEASLKANRAMRAVE